jgi:hypothetical protein
MTRALTRAGYGLTMAVVNLRMSLVGNQQDLLVLV